MVGSRVTLTSSMVAHLVEEPGPVVLQHPQLLVKEGHGLTGLPLQLADLLQDVAVRDGAGRHTVPRQLQQGGHHQAGSDVIQAPLYCRGDHLTSQHHNQLVRADREPHFVLLNNLPTFF